MNNFKSGFISVVGRPNVGKSTLLNSILGEKLVITSHKPQTTRNAIRCIYTDDDSQIVFIDTPGMTTPKNKLGSFMQNSATGSLSDVEAILYIIEPDKKLGPSDRKILEMLEKQNAPVIALINKIDTIEKEELLEVINTLSSYDFIEEIIPISALKGDGIDIVLDSIKKRLPEGPKYFPEEMIIDQSERFIISEIIREKILRSLKEEIPHGTAVEITSMKARENGDKIDIEANIICERKGHKRIIIGKNGSMLKKIGTRAREDIEFFLKQPVNLELWIKVKDKWRDKPMDLSDLGYVE